MSGGVERRPGGSSRVHETLGDGASHDTSGPGKRTLTEQLAPDLATGTASPVQRRSAGAPEDPQSVHAAAEHGTAGSSGRLPFGDLIQRAFGRHDIGGIQAHTDGAAAAGASAMGARAFATGHRVAFAGAPDLHTAAHEAAHVVQQRGGVQLKGGVGQVGDSYEQHADAVADRVVAGESAEGLLDQMAGGSAASSAGPGAVQRDLAVPPTRPDADGRALTPQQMVRALQFNRQVVTDAHEISMLRDILGRGREPAVIDEDFVTAVVAYQAQYGLTQDGQLGPVTRARLGREILAEDGNGDAATHQGLQPGLELRDQLNQLMDAGTTTYATFRTTIRGSTDVKRSTALADTALLQRLRGHLPWDSFARCVELLGRRAPAFAELVARGDVQAQLRAAWTASGPRVSAPGDGGAQHEEGGWIYLDLITESLAFRRQAAGGGAAINLAAPPIINGHVAVAKFHTHPNLGPNWNPGPSAIDVDGDGVPDRGDVVVDPNHGVPDIVVNTPGVNPANFTTALSGPARRLHLAGNQGLPGAAGGLAP
jgi:hypothetical protein